MKEPQRTIIRFIAAIELIGAAFFYCCGKGGMQAIRAADAIHLELQKEITALETDITALERELDERLHNPYYKESVARKQLQMAYQDETIYVLPEAKDVSAP